jgi:thymidine kinase
MSLSVYTGPMFSGKTSYLIRDITEFCDLPGNNKALLINHALDTRDIEHKISSHSSSYNGLSSKITCVSTDDLSTVDVSDYPVIGIDEASFFEMLVPQIKHWLSLGKDIVCSGLDGNYRMERFGNIADLLPLSDKFIKLNAKCSLCVQELIDNGGTLNSKNTVLAPFTRKLCTNHHGGNTNDIDIGGADKYIAVCRRHHKY